MVRIARERVSALFELAESEATSGHGDLADRYVHLARRIGTRYNVRLLAEFRELYCRSCSSFWVEGRTVRTRLRSGVRVRTCLRCGGERRTRIRSGVVPSSETAESGPTPAAGPDEVLVAAGPDGEPSELEGEEPEEE